MADLPNPRVGVATFVFKNGKFLIGQRYGAHGEGTWSIPGGHLEFGETFEQTARRETKEETTLEIDNVEYAATTNDIFYEENKHYITIWMTSTYKDGTETIVEPDKFVRLAWVDFESLPEPLFLPWQQLFKSSGFDIIKQRLKNS